jgi:hypothetical protein
MDIDEFPLLVKGHIFQCFCQRGCYGEDFRWRQSDTGNKWAAVCKCGNGVCGDSLDDAVEKLKKSYLAVRDGEHWHYQDTPRFNIILGTDGKWIMGTITDRTLLGETARKGAAFLLEEITAEEIFTREDLSDEHRAVGQMVEEFWANEVEPNLPAIREKKPGVALGVLRKSAALGLLGISVPEKFGGMEMDLPSVMVVAEVMGRDASYAGWHSAHTGIGSLPILFFGTEAQKEKYLPKLVKGELLAAYALTEPLAGSDALAARTRADLSTDGPHYILNGQKMWITNGGAADVFIVFAKVGGEKFTAFIVERAFGGLTSGAEEHKMGIRGSSTTALYFDNVKVPVENVLGEIGRGHVIAFNILNIGRLKLGPAVMGAAKSILASSTPSSAKRLACRSRTLEPYNTSWQRWRFASLPQSQWRGA